MADQPITSTVKIINPPKNDMVKAMKITMDVLIKDLGAEAAVIAAQVACPVLAAPFISQVFSWAVGWVAYFLDEGIKENLVVLIMRIQGHMRVEEFDEAIAKLKSNPTQENRNEVNKDIDNVINRNRTMFPK